MWPTICHTRRRNHTARIVWIDTKHCDVTSIGEVLGRIATTSLVTWPDDARLLNIAAVDVEPSQAMAEFAFYDVHQGSWSCGRSALGISRCSNPPALSQSRVCVSARFIKLSACEKS